MFTLKWTVKFNSGLEVYSRHGIKDFSYQDNQITIFFENYPIFSEKFLIIGQLINIELIEEN